MWRKYVIWAINRFGITDIKMCNIVGKSSRFRKKKDTNYVYMIYLSLIYLHFFVIDSLWWIKFFPHVIYWIQNLCLLYYLFDEYNYAILKYYFKMSIDQCMMWYFFCSMLCSMLWYGVVWNSIVFCSVLFGNMGWYIVVECIQSVF